VIEHRAGEDDDKPKFRRTGVVSDVTANARPQPERRWPDQIAWLGFSFYSRAQCHRAPKSPLQSGDGPVLRRCNISVPLELEAKHELNLPRQTGAGFGDEALSLCCEIVGRGDLTRFPEGTSVYWLGIGFPVPSLPGHS